jgi:hypothetical protein
MINARNGPLALHDPRFAGFDTAPTISRAIALVEARRRWFARNRGSRPINRPP